MVYTMFHGIIIVYNNVMRDILHMVLIVLFLIVFAQMEHLQFMNMTIPIIMLVIMKRFLLSQISFGKTQIFCAIDVKKIVKFVIMKVIVANAKSLLFIFTINHLMNQYVYYNARLVMLEFITIMKIIAKVI